MRGVDATVKFATAAPDGVKRSSGSAVRFPTTVMVVSPATSSSWAVLSALRASAHRCRPLEVSRRRAYGSTTTRTRPSGLVLVGPQHLGPQHGLVQVQLAIELGHGRGLGLHVDDGVDAFG